MNKRSCLFSTKEGINLVIILKEKIQMKLILQWDKKIKIDKALIHKLLVKDLPVSGISGYFNLEFLETGEALAFSRLKEEIKGVNGLLKSKGISLNLLLNDACFGGRNLTPSYQRRLDSLFEFTSTERLSLVVMEPTLIEYIVSNHPEVDLAIFAASSHGIFDFHLRVQYYKEYLGQKERIRGLIIPSDLNRDFNALQKIRKNWDLELWVNVNEGDLLCSPYKLSELTSLSHLHPHGDYLCYKEVEDIFWDWKREVLFNDPWRLIASPWIRPEDLNFYQEMGIDCFNIMVGEEMEIEIDHLINSYRNMRFEGNLISLWKEARQIRGIFLDNRWFDGFLERLKAKGGCIRDCPRCKVCLEIEEEYSRRQG